MLIAAAQKKAHAAHSLSRLGELHVKAFSWVARLARAPSLHVNRPLGRQLLFRGMHGSVIKMMLKDVLVPIADERVPTKVK